MKSLTCIVILVVAIESILIPIVPAQKPCMAAFTDYEPLKLQVIFPEIPNKIDGQKFTMTVVSTEDPQDTTTHIRQQGDTFKGILNITEGVLYQICFEFVTNRYSLPNNQSILINYHLTDDLENLIGTIEVPQDLVKQKKLSDLYLYANQIKKTNKKIAESQEKQRKLQDDIAQLHIEKNLRIVSLTLIECAVIILSGVYQVFALRRFLIDKNLY